MECQDWDTSAQALKAVILSIVISAHIINILLWHMYEAPSPPPPHRATLTVPSFAWQGFGLSQVEEHSWRHLGFIFCYGRGKRKPKTMHITFFDVCGACDFLSHTTAFRKLQLNGIQRSLLSFLKPLLTGRSFFLKARGTRSFLDAAIQGVLQGSLLSILFFKIVLAALRTRRPFRLHIHLRRWCCSIISLTLLVNS